MPPHGGCGPSAVWASTPKGRDRKRAMATRRATTPSTSSASSSRTYSFIPLLWRKMPRLHNWHHSRVTRLTALSSDGASRGRRPMLLQQTGRTGLSSDRPLPNHLCRLPTSTVWVVGPCAVPGRRTAALHLQEVAPCRACSWGNPSSTQLVPFADKAIADGVSKVVAAKVAAPAIWGRTERSRP